MGPEQEKRTSTPERLALSGAVALDPRLADVWQLVWGSVPPEIGGEEGDAVTFESMGPLLRLAYLQGYGDAQTEAERGELYREIGVRPSVTSNARSGPRPPRGPARRGSSGR